MAPIVQSAGGILMRHTLEEVIKRAIRETELLDTLITHLSNTDWELTLPRPSTKDPWTVKDVLAHITHWKADVVRSLRGQRRSPEEHGLNETETNHLVFLRWHDRPWQDVLTWHRRVQQEVLTALRSAPDTWFSGRERRPEWPFDLDGHSAYHRIKDLQQVLEDKD
jgi:hypothetical protein